AVAYGNASTRVLELSDRFLELRGESTWLIMFYAPWCGHCKKLEPSWNHVAHSLYGTEIRVGRVDCTRFTQVATEFAVKGFPTIMFVRGDERHIFRGDRTKEDIIGFAIRMAAPSVQHFSSVGHLKQTISTGDLFFAYAGSQDGLLWENYKVVAEDNRYFNYFYSIDGDSIMEYTEVEELPTVMVFKDNMHFFYPGLSEEELNIEFVDKEQGSEQYLNESLTNWVSHERFSLFTKITHGLMPQLWKINKYLAITVVHEDKIGRITTDENAEDYVDGYKFRDMMESVIRNNREKYHEYFQFGWTGIPELANSIAMERLQLPSLLVVNASTMHHHLPDDPPHHLTTAAVEMFLDSILNKTATAYGGDSWLVRVYRIYYNSRTSLEDMWQGNPVLTSVLFGLPLGFLSLICYSIWCSDIMDADEEEEEHEKKE
ncbi:unnamed protein product, partial [Meganyctiphanes norvegica]